MSRSTLLAAALSSLAALPAFAGGLAEPAPAPVTVAPVPVVSTMDWTGPSVGVQLGYGDVSTSGAAALDGDDVLYGLRAYYDFDFGDYILGGGLQYDSTDIALGTVTTVDSVTRLGARAGIDLGRNWVYGTAGWAQRRNLQRSRGRQRRLVRGCGLRGLRRRQRDAGRRTALPRFRRLQPRRSRGQCDDRVVSVNFRF
jgi:outer membrane immunogenic protein